MKKRPLLFLPAALLAVLLCLTGAARAAGTGDEIPDNGIPVVYLRIDESKGTIQDMNESPDHSAYCYGAMSIDVPEGFRYSDFPDVACQSVEDLDMSIRGRGNSTWQRAAKKPYKIKLDSKADLFGLGANKHWVLVANALDESLLKDRITGWLGDEMGFAFTPRGVPVDVVMIGETFGTHYIGSYYLSENVRVDKNRLEIDELSADDTAQPTITGGYLLQDALQVRYGSPDIFYTTRGVDWATHTPSFDTEEESSGGGDSSGPFKLEESFAVPELGDGYENRVQQEYIQAHIQRFEDTLFEGGTAWRDLMDVESAAKYWLVNEFSLNNDAYNTGSTYIYKVRDTDGTVGKLYWGPLWDFDFAWNYGKSTAGFSIAHAWLRPMFCDRGEGGFVEEVKAQWQVLRPAVVELCRDGGVIDRYAAETRASAEQDHLLRFGPDETYSYLDEAEALKVWIRDRLAWVDAHIAEVEDLAHQVTYIVDGEVFALDFKDTGRPLERGAGIPDKAGYVFLGWTDEDGAPVDEDTPVTRDMTLTATFLPDGEATHAQDIAFRRSSDIVRYNVHIFRYFIDYLVVPEDAQEQVVTWSSSDEGYATVDADGVVTYSGPGEVTLTAKLKNGVTRSFTLTVTEGELPVPEAILPQQDVIRMTVGEQSALIVDTRPSPAGIAEFSYYSADEDTVIVDSYGVLKAVGPGVTTVKVTAVPEGGPGTGGADLEAEVTVIVSPFTDVPKDAYYYDSVCWAVGRGITAGTSADTFSPGGTCTRAQMVTFLWRAAGEPSPTASSTCFTDVDTQAYYYDAVLWAVEKGITTGTSDTAFSPDAAVTRGQAVTFLWRAAGEPSPAAGENPFADVKAGDYFCDAVLWAVEKGVTTGTSKTAFSPGDDCLRCQVVTFLNRAYGSADQV